jgi:hypothetical protein
VQTGGGKKHLVFGRHASKAIACSLVLLMRSCRGDGARQKQGCVHSHLGQLREPGQAHVGTNSRHAWTDPKMWLEVTGQPGAGRHPKGGGGGRVSR